MIALATAVNPTIGIIANTNAPIVLYLVRIAGATIIIATTTKLIPLARVPRKVEMAGAIESLPIRDLYIMRQVTAPMGSLIRFAGGKMEWLKRAQTIPATIPIPITSVNVGITRIIARQ